MILASVLAAGVALVPQVAKLEVRPGFCTLTNIVFWREASIPKEGYRLSVSEDCIRVVSSDEAGRFYALQTIRQLRDGAGLPCVEIEDAPAYRWRGVHFDDCRHFFGKETLKKTIDLMAQHKFNVLHWHLTEDQAWRLEIPGYPDLVKYGAVRPGSPRHWRPKEVDGMQYGPFYYTEADVREILAFAAERQVTVVPEIELPGHVYAALAAYPQFACVPKNLSHRHPRLFWGIEKDVLCLGNNAAVRFMEDVLDHVCRLFPSPYVHIGGDECPTERWKECANCRARIESVGLSDEKELQPWITRHFVDFLAKRGKRAIGWDEYLNGDVPSSAVGMNWRTHSANGAGHGLLSVADAVAKGHDMIMAPHDQTYFYYGQGLADDPFEYGGKIQVTLRKVYDFDPSADVPEKDRSHVLGGQCCNWSEYTWNECDLDWKLWPRGCAMAETLWAGARKPGYEDFVGRMSIHRLRLLRQGVNCAPLDAKGECQGGEVIWKRSQSR